MLPIACLIALSVYFLASLSASVTPIHLLTRRSPTTSILIDDRTINELTQGAEAARAAIAQNYPQRPAQSWLLVSFGMYKQFDAPSGFLLVDLHSPNALLDAPTIVYACQPLSSVVQLERSLSATGVKGTAEFMQYRFLVEGWLLEEGLFDEVVEKFNQAQISPPGQSEKTPGYIAYLHVMHELYHLPGYFDLQD